MRFNAAQKRLNSSFVFESMLKFRSLYESPIVSVRDYSCRACRGGPAAEEHAGSNDIVLMRHGVFCRHFGRRSITTEINQATFFSKGSSYRVSHPADCGDRGTVFVVAPDVLNDIIREFNPAIDERPEQLFPFATGPCNSDAFGQHRELLSHLESAQTPPVEPIWADVTALQLIANVLQAAFLRHGLRQQRRRPRTDADHIDRAEAAKSYLASHLGERITLDGVARAVHASPYHLARIFRQRTGMPIHRYLVRLRLRTSLERLAEGANDLTELALEYGFSSHSHYTDAFRREFGRTPSDERRSRAS